MFPIISQSQTRHFYPIYSLFLISYESAASDFILHISLGDNHVTDISSLLEWLNCHIHLKQILEMLNIFAGTIKKL